MSRLFVIILLLYHVKCIRSEGNICCFERTVRDKCSSEFKDRINLNCSDGEMFSFPLENLQINNTNLIVNGVEYNTSRYCLHELDPTDETPFTVQAVLCIPHEHLMHAADLEPEPETIIDANMYSIMIFITLDVASLALLTATIAIYWILPEIRDLQGSCVLHFLTNYCLTYIIFGTITVRIPLPCFVRAYGCIFFSFASFFWLTVSAFHVWSTSIPQRLEDVRTYLFYSLCGYGLPAIMLLTIFFVQSITGGGLRPTFTEPDCWFRDEKTRWWYYHMPITILLFVNIFLYIHSIRRLKYLYESRVNIYRIKTLQTRFCLYSRLFLVIGFTWLFEIISQDIFPQIAFLPMITDVMVCLQGFCIFILLVATRKRVLKRLAKRKPCTLNCFPNAWITYMDSESEDENHHPTHGIELVEVLTRNNNSVF